jgi:hypothetical protein
MDLLTFESSATVRKYQDGDWPDLYRICLVTDDSGKDATLLYNEKSMLPEVYTGPYLTFATNLSFTLVDKGIAGYVLGVLDTKEFENLLADKWWPQIQNKYTGQSDKEFTPVELEILQMIHNPPQVDRVILEKYPSHLHINLLDRVQGRGLGKAKMGIGN